MAARKTARKTSSTADKLTHRLRFNSSIDLPADKRADTVALLNRRLADFLDLERQAKQAHWNVRGPRFHQLHLLFDEIATCAVTWADELAERAMQLGGIAEGTVQVIATRTSLPEAPLIADSAETWIRVVVAALAGSANAARKDIETTDDAGDAITTDLLTRITGEADKQLWFVEAHLDGK